MSALEVFKRLRYNNNNNNNNLLYYC